MDLTICKGFYLNHNLKTPFWIHTALEKYWIFFVCIYLITIQLIYNIHRIIINIIPKKAELTDNYKLHQSRKLHITSCFL